MFDQVVEDYNCDHRTEQGKQGDVSKVLKVVRSPDSWREIGKQEIDTGDGTSKQECQACNLDTLKRSQFEFYFIYIDTITYGGCHDEQSEEIDSL